MTISTKFEVDTTVHYLAFLLLIHCVTLTIDFSALVIGHTCWLFNPSTKFEDHSWVMTSDITHTIPLTMRLQPLHTCRITWPVHKGKFFTHIWNPWPRFVCPLCNLYGCMIKINWFSAKIVYSALLQTTYLSAHAQNHIILESSHKSVNKWLLMSFRLEI